MEFKGRRLSKSPSSPLDTQISGKAGSDVGRPGGCQDAINATALASDKVFKSTVPKNPTWKHSQEAFSTLHITFSKNVFSLTQFPNLSLLLLFFTLSRRFYSGAALFKYHNSLALLQCLTDSFAIDDQDFLPYITRPWICASEVNLERAALLCS